MKLGKGMIIGIAGLVLIAVIVPGVLLSLPPRKNPNALMGDDFFAIRREALSLFPRGSRVIDATAGMMDLGFRCTQTPHKMANVNAPSVICDSNGRGYPKSPTLSVTVLGRNGLLSDIEVWNMLQKADAETPPPAALPPHEQAIEHTAEKAHD